MSVGYPHPFENAKLALMLNYSLVGLYLRLISWGVVGYWAGKICGSSLATYIGQFLFWIGVPFSIVVFIRNADLSEPVWMAAGIAWIAVFLSGLLAFALSCHQDWSRATQGSFYLASMFGNTGYLGYPVILTLFGSKVFAWALFYDLAGTTLAAYGLGVAIASLHGRSQICWHQLINTIVKNPALWSIPVGMGLRKIPLAPLTEQLLSTCAWGVIHLSLMLIGMRLSTLKAQPRISPMLLGLGIKMVTIPLVLSWVLPALGLTGDALRAIVLQMAMPPAFAALVLTEAFDLDRDLAVSMLVSGALGLLILIPVWLWVLR